MLLLEESWSKLVYPGITDELNRFEISTFGRLRNIKTGYIYKPNILNNGYSTVRTTLGSKKHKIHIIMHKAVAYTYIPNHNNLPEINHKDGIRFNNVVTNLEWCTTHDNQKHKYDAGHFDIRKISGENNHASKLTWEDVNYIRSNYINGSREFGSKPLARKFNVSSAVIKSVVDNKTWKEIDCDLIDTIKREQENKRQRLLKIMNTGHVKHEKKKFYCSNCGKEISNKAKLCKQCAYQESLLVKNRPNKIELTEYILRLGYLGTGREFGVSDNTIRKWCKSMEIPTKKKEFLIWHKNLFKVA